LPSVSDYHIFKKGIRPVWEDKENRKGGKWIVRLKKGVADRYWEDLLLAIVGDQFAEAGDEVCGAVLSVRTGEDVLSVWTRIDGGRNIKIRYVKYNQVLLAEVYPDGILGKLSSAFSLFLQTLTSCGKVMMTASRSGRLSIKHDRRRAAEEMAIMVQINVAVTTVVISRSLQTHSTQVALCSVSFCLWRFVLYKKARHAIAAWNGFFIRVHVFYRRSFNDPSVMHQ
jgi:hypothetical protein